MGNCLMRRFFGFNHTKRKQEDHSTTGSAPISRKSSVLIDISHQVRQHLQLNQVPIQIKTTGADLGQEGTGTNPKFNTN
jgi:hypothetical protein